MSKPSEVEDANVTSGEAEASPMDGAMAATGALSFALPANDPPKPPVHHAR